MSTRNLIELADQLKEKFGTHAKVAELLMIRPASYYAVRTGRANPSRRLVRAMSILLDITWIVDDENRETNRGPIPKELWAKLNPK